MANLQNLTSWGADWKNLRVAVFGLGVTGFSVADTLAELQCDVLVVAEKAEADLVDILDVIGVRHQIGEAARGVSAELISHNPELIVTSPGVRPDSELIRWAKANEIPVWVDIDLAWRLRDKAKLTSGGPIPEWLCITGTNGKTTTTQLTEAMLVSGSIRAIACGNIGAPILDAIRDPQGFEAIVVELSSFQLHYLGEISPYSSAVLNIADDHLDWHGGFEEYSLAKGKVFANTKVACVYNCQDSATEQMVQDAEVIEGARAIGFSLGVPARSQVGYVEDILCDRAFLDDRANSALEIATLEQIERIGVITPHLLANIAAATALARSFDVPPAAIREAINNFKLDSHRIELVAQTDGVSWFDDSKATNPHAAAASLASFENVVWIVGGLLKGVDISDLVKANHKRIKAAIVIGLDRSPVLSVLAEHAPNVPIVEITDSDKTMVMARAVNEAAKVAQPGDVVLLAPAAASMDQFKDYADRGEQFAGAVRLHLGSIGDGDMQAGGSNG